MQIIINGEKKSTGAATVAALIDELGLDIRKCAIEYNRAIVPRPDYPRTLLNEGDIIEIVQFIGGG